MTRGARIESFIVPAPGFASAHAALKIAELADVHAQLERAVSDLAPDALAWRQVEGDNTIGTLLAHVALVEVHLGQVGLAGERDGHVADVLGIEADERSMPRSPVEGRDAAFALDLLARALAHTRERCRDLDDALLAAEVERPARPDGSRRVFDRRWVLHHMVEHAARHLGQVHLILRRWRSSREGR